MSDGLSDLAAFACRAAGPVEGPSGRGRFRCLVVIEHYAIYFSIQLQSIMFLGCKQSCKHDTMSWLPDPTIGENYRNNPLR